MLAEMRRGEGKKSWHLSAPHIQTILAYAGPGWAEPTGFLYLDTPRIRPSGNSKQNVPEFCITCCYLIPDEFGAVGSKGLTAMCPAFDAVRPGLHAPFCMAAFHTVGDSGPTFRCTCVQLLHLLCIGTGVPPSVYRAWSFFSFVTYGWCFNVIITGFPPSFLSGLDSLLWDITSLTPVCLT